MHVKNNGIHMISTFTYSIILSLKLITKVCLVFTHQYRVVHCTYEDGTAMHRSFGLFEEFRSIEIWINTAQKCACIVYTILDSMHMYFTLGKYVFVTFFRLML